MLMLAMTATILPEPVQAAESGFTTDLVDLRREAEFQIYGKVGKGGANFANTVVRAPEGATLYIERRESCSGKSIYRVYYEGRMWSVYSKDVAELKDTAHDTAYREWWNREKVQGKKIKVKTALVGDVMDPCHYYYIYAKPNATDGNCIGAVAVGADVSVINENYNSKWAEILWGQAKKAKLTYSGILQNYDKNLTKAEFCRLAVNWYQATGHKLPKQSTKSTYTDTNDPYVIMAYQLGIVKDTTNKEFQPDKKPTCSQYNALMKNLLRVTKDEKKVYDYVSERSSSYWRVSRETAIRSFYRAYRLVQKKDYLISSDDYAVSRNVYTISPTDNPNVCLDVFNKANESGAEIGLYKNNGDTNQKFFLYNVNGFTIINNAWSQKTLNGTTQKVYQDYREYEAEKMRFQYNNDGTVCIINGDGLYLDIKDGQAVSGAHLMFAPKSGSSTQKWVFSDLYY